MEDAINEIQTIFKKFGFDFNKEIFTEDKKTILGSATNGTVSFDILFLLENGKYFAYDLSSNGLPREVYSDSVRKGFTAEQRSSEIINTINRLLSKDVKFCSSPSVFNRNRGFLLLKIDGNAQKIFQKRNHFNLPSDEGHSVKN
jgi:hypothetical protein